MNRIYETAVSVIFLCLIFSANAFAGEWIADKFSGCQVWNESPEQGESMSWSGACLNNKATGSGIMEFNRVSGNRVVTTSTFEGEFLEGKKHGKGTLTWANGDRYEGDWVDNKMQGKGTKFHRSGDRYEGDWVDGKMHGKGKYIWSSEHYYEGNFVNNRFEGFGHMYNKYCCKTGFFECASWCYVDDKGLFENDKFVKGCNSEKGCQLMIKLSDKIKEYERNYKCEEANKLDMQLQALGEGFFDNKYCISQREYSRVLTSGNTQDMYLKAVKYENNNERGKAKRIYLTIMDKFSKSAIAIKAAERLAALSDVEAVEGASRSQANAISNANQDAAARSKATCQAQRMACWNSCNSIKGWSARDACQNACIVCP